MNGEELSLREKILDTSRHFLFTKGYSSLSMRKIAKEIGVSATSIYLYFENKDHLVHTLIEESVEELSRAIEQSAAQKISTIDKFEAIIRAYVEFAMSYSEKYQVIYVMLSSEMSRYPKEKFRKARRGYALLESVIKKGIEEGLMELDEPQIAAYSIWAQLHGVISVVLNQRLDSKIDRNKFIEESIEHIVQGFLVRITTA
ncbi:MAG: TetR/AcrR family transcriptional regulator [Balneolaceae bacterium]|nr:TetR/AcrR family transcriptional regulator [Balneolaceae bacterium]MBO6547876.1 TetR/AcrR family transcriptional regulator [Balneolaceae bacterium]MBO6648389.1 TetR/AcrR family transcriptional regulator [Balneolaceae bacterium]